MRAILWTNYGPPEVLTPAEVDKPLPGDEEILIKIYATTVTAGDCEIRGLTLPGWVKFPMRLYTGFKKPKRIRILGQDLAGEVEAVGKNISGFKKGDRVFGTTGISLGGYAEYKCLKVNPGAGVLALIPDDMTFQEAVLIPTGGIEALHTLKKAEIQKGEKVLIIGAGGSIGSFAIQLAKYFGAEVTGVDRTEKLNFLKDLGADEVIDYTKENYLSRKDSYNVILDVVGKNPLSRMVKSLKQKGRLLLTNPQFSHLIRGKWISMTGNRKVKIPFTNASTEDLQYLAELVRKGIIKPVIDRIFALEEIVEAHRYADSGKKKGNIVINI